MQKRLIAFFLCLLLALPCLPAADALWQPDFELQGASIYLIDLTGGEAIIDINSREVRSPASLTKMMTVLLALEHKVNWNDRVTVPERLRDELVLIEVENGMSINMQVGETFTVEQLLYLTMLPSCNDAASVLADYIAGDLDTFIGWMNQRAKELGCTGTRFNCAHGLFEEIGDGNWSTAYDMALIAQECIKHPDFMKLATTYSYWLPLSDTRRSPHSSTSTLPVVPAGMYRLMYSTNPMQDPANGLYRGYDRGLKTGYTTWADRCFVTMFEQGDQRFLLSELGVPDVKDETGHSLVFSQAAALGDWVLVHFAYQSAAVPGQTITLLPVRCSADGTSVALNAVQPLGALCYNGEKLTWQYDLPESLEAPIQAGQVVGSATLMRGEEAIGTIELAAAEDMEYSTFVYIRDKIAEFFLDLYYRFFRAG